MRKINLKKVGKIAPIIGVAIFIYIVYDIGFEKIANAFASIPIQYFVLALLLVFLRLFLYVYKWSYICIKMKIYISYLDLLKIYLIGIFYGTLTPAALGLHLRIFYMRKKSKSTIGKFLANSFIDIELALISGLFIGLLGTIIFFNLFPEFLAIIFLLFLINVTILVVFMKKTGGSKFFKIFIRPFIPQRYREGIDQSVELLYEDMPKIRDMGFPVLMDMAVWIIMGIQVYIIAQGLSVNIDFFTFILLHTISVVTYIILPISVGGLGVREGIFVFLLLPFGVKAEIAFVISLSGYIVKMLFPAIIGMFFLLKER
jgi:uncharacterized protein (TIRG00374 family)